MGWGCYKHEMDKGSIAWDIAVQEATPEPYTSWGRDEEVCPKCYMEAVLYGELLHDLLKERTGQDVRLCSRCDGQKTILVEAWWPPNTQESAECGACGGTGLYTILVFPERTQ